MTRHFEWHDEISFEIVFNALTEEKVSTKEFKKMVEMDSSWMGGADLWHIKLVRGAGLWEKRRIGVQVYDMNGSWRGEVQVRGKNAR